jgi:hypothetical protein
MVRRCHRNYAHRGIAMKKRLIALSLAALTIAPAMAGIKLPDAQAFPPGPSIIAVLMSLFSR